MTDTAVDLVVLGGGSAGYACAMRAAELGSSVVLIERDKLGGTCLHRGCVPTKALLHAAEVADEIKEAAAVGLRAKFDGVDVDGLHQYKNAIVGKHFKGLTGLVASRGVQVVAGDGVFAGGRSVNVGDDTYTGTNVVLATGSYSKSLPGLAIEGRVITSEQALELQWVPQRALVLGGGVIGVEFASVWASLGAEVTIIEALPSLGPAEDPWVGEQRERACKKRKIAFKTGVRFSGVTQDESGVTVTLESGESLTGDLLLVAVGRGPATEGCGFAEAGVEMDRGFVLTNERLATNLPNVYAVGDIVPGLQLAHRGFQQGIFVAEEIAGRGPIVVPDSRVPRITYCDPQIASIGLTEQQATDEYGEVETLVYNTAGNAKTDILRTAGGIKVVRAKDGPVVGFHMVGARIGEILGEAQLIVNWEAYPEDVAPYVHGHPTQYEAIGETMLAMAGKPLHVHS